MRWGRSSCGNNGEWECVGEGTKRWMIMKNVWMKSKEYEFMNVSSINARMEIWEREGIKQWMISWVLFYSPRYEYEYVCLSFLRLFQFTFLISISTVADVHSFPIIFSFLQLDVELMRSSSTTGSLLLPQLHSAPPKCLHMYAYHTTWTSTWTWMMLKLIAWCLDNNRFMVMYSKI